MGDAVNEESGKEELLQQKRLGERGEVVSLMFMKPSHGGIGCERGFAWLLLVSLRFLLLFEKALRDACSLAEKRHE